MLFSLNWKACWEAVIEKKINGINCNLNIKPSTESLAASETEWLNLFNYFDCHSDGCSHSSLWSNSYLCRTNFVKTAFIDFLSSNISQRISWHQVRGAGNYQNYFSFFHTTTNSSVGDLQWSMKYVINISGWSGWGSYYYSRI